MAKKLAAKPTARRSSSDQEKRHNVYEKRHEDTQKRLMASDKRQVNDDRRHLVSEVFEETTTRTLLAQDALLERMEARLDAEVLNGGFDNLMVKITKIETINEQLHATQKAMGERVESIYTGLYDHEKGLYSKVKDNVKWIDMANKAIVWGAALVITGILTGIGKLLYDFASGHFHYLP